MHVSTANGGTTRRSLPPMPNVALRRSGATADWQICIAGRCRAMGSYLPDRNADPVTLTACS